MTEAVSAMQTDIRVESVTFDYEDFRYRTPIKFGGVALDRVTLLNVRCSVRTRDGRTAEGRASMPLGNVWAFPSKRLSYADTLGAMKGLAGRIAALTGGHGEDGHPSDLNHALELAYFQAGDAA